MKNIVKSEYVKCVVIAIVILSATVLSICMTSQPVQYTDKALNSQIQSPNVKPLNINISINITSPKEGAILPSGTPVNIIWNTTNVSAPCTVALAYSNIGPTGPYNSIVNSQPKNGSYAFTPPAVTQLWLRANVSETTAPSHNASCIRHVFINVVSNPTIVINSPAANAFWQGGGTYPINWTSSGGTPPLVVKLTYSMTFPMAASGTIATGQKGTGIYNWKLPMTIVAGYLTITANVTDANMKNASASVSVIVLPPFMVTVTPGTATVLEGGTVGFTATATQINLNGTTTPITSGIVYMWNVTSTDGLTHGTVNPTLMSNTTTFTAILRGSCTVNCIGYMMSSQAIGLPGSATVTVTVPTPPVVYFITPVDGEIFKIGSQIPITWNISGDPAGAPYNLDLTYSINGGNNYTIITSGTQANPGIGQLNWLNPSIPVDANLSFILQVTDKFSQLVNATVGNITFTEPSHLRVFSGDNTNGIVNSTAMILVAIATDNNENPVAGVTVNWSIINSPPNSELQYLLMNQSQTDNEGKAITYLHFGTVSGTYRINALSSDIPGQEIYFTLNALPDAPARLVLTPSSVVLKVGDSQNFESNIYDNYSNSITDRNITWSVEGNIGIINDGYFIAVNAGMGNVTAICGLAIGMANVTVSNSPVVTAVQPQKDAVNISTDVMILITFSKEMDWQSVENAITISPGVKLEMQWISNTFMMKAATGFALNLDTKYTITIKATCTDTQGNMLDGNNNGISQGSPTDDFSWSFTTKKTPTIGIPPIVESYYPFNNSVLTDSKIYVKFSKSMNTTSVESAFSLTTGKLNVAGTIAWTDSDSNLTFTPKNGLAKSTQYRVTIDGTKAKDTEGLYLDGNKDGVGEGTQNDTVIWEFVTSTSSSTTTTSNQPLTTKLTYPVALVIILIVLLLLIFAATKKKKPVKTEPKKRKINKEKEKAKEDEEETTKTDKKSDTDTSKTDDKPEMKKSTDDDLD